ncbi:hypothetical protein [Mycobacterium sp. D16R24]|uniref:hypothetical protein n=1 Tax=Mycobacterium sp. D16R24 TaxID=1855656 RepID=UPI0015907456|nr:hypothetical protein [Mycobacterium sp. D16R24]
MSALGGGIKLAVRGATSVTVVEFDGSMKRFSEPVLAVIAALGVVAGAVERVLASRGG